MKNTKMEPNEKIFIYRNPGDPIEITDEMLENAEINPNELVDIILQKGCVIIKPTSVLGRLPEELLLLYEELGFSREMVECVFTKYAEEAGGFDALVEQIKKEKNVALWQGRNEWEMIVEPDHLLQLSEALEENLEEPQL